MSTSEDSIVSMWQGARYLRTAFQGSANESDARNCEAAQLVKDGHLNQMWSGGERVQNHRSLWKDVQYNNIAPPVVGNFCKTLASDHVNCTREHHGVLQIEVCDEVKDLLPRALLPPTARSLFQEGPQAHMLWATFMIFDENANRDTSGRNRGSYFYRTLRSLGGDTTPEDIIFLLLYRLPELGDIESPERPERLCCLRTRAAGIPNSLGSGWILDFSDKMRSTEFPNYVLLRTPPGTAEPPPEHLGAIYCGDVWDSPAIKEKASRLRKDLLKAFPPGDPILVSLARDPFTDVAAAADSRSLDRLWELNHVVKTHLFDESTLDPDSRILINTFVETRLRPRIGDDVLTLGEQAVQIANYFVWLATLSDQLQAYYVRHVYDFRFSGSDGKNYRRAFKPSGIVVASRLAQPSTDVAARAEILMSTVLGPLNDYYATQNLGAARVAMYARGAAHTLKNAIAIPAWRSDGVTDTYNSFMSGDESWKADLEELGKGTEAGEIGAALGRAASVPEDVEFLRRQAEMMFWIMDPARMTTDLRILDDNEGFSERRARALIARAVAAGVAKHTPRELGLGKEDDSGRAKIISSVLESQGQNDFAASLTEAVGHRIDFNVTLCDVALSGFDFRVAENVAFELVTNATSRALGVDSAELRFELSAEDGFAITIENTAQLSLAEALCANWNEPMVYEDGGSRGVSGIHQMQLLVLQAREKAHSRIQMRTPRFEALNTEFALVHTGLVTE